MVTSSQFAGISVAAFFFTLFFIPELKGRSLEETDELFEMNLWAWQFADAQTTGVGRRIAMLEEGDARGETLKAHEAVAVEDDRVKVGDLVHEIGCHAHRDLKKGK